MKSQTRARLLRRLLFAAVLLALLYTGPAATTRLAAAQYPYGCSCTGLYSAAHSTCSSRGGLSNFQCSYTGSGNSGSFTCGDGSQWTNSCSY
jgi:hypothetical protein